MKSTNEIAKNSLDLEQPLSALTLKFGEELLDITNLNKIIDKLKNENRKLKRKIKAIKNK